MPWRPANIRGSGDSLQTANQLLRETNNRIDALQKQVTALQTIVQPTIQGSSTFQSGYFNLAPNLLVQFGVSNVVPANSSVTVKFPKTFVAAPYFCIVGVPYFNGGTAAVSLANNQPTAASVVITNKGTVGSDANWLAIGPI